MELSGGGECAAHSFQDSTDQLEHQSEILVTVDTSCQACVPVISKSVQTLTKNTQDSVCQTDLQSLEATLWQDPLMLKFYTGIPDWHVFKSLYDMAAVDVHVSSKLSKFDMFLLFFMEICLMKIWHFGLMYIVQLCQGLFIVF